MPLGHYKGGPWSAPAAPPPGCVLLRHWWRAHSAAACACVGPPGGSSFLSPAPWPCWTLALNRTGWSACFSYVASTRWWGWQHRWWALWPEPEEEERERLKSNHCQCCLFYSKGEGYCWSICVYAFHVYMETYRVGRPQNRVTLNHMEIIILLWLKYLDRNAAGPLATLK